MASDHDGMTSNDDWFRSLPVYHAPAGQLPRDSASPLQSQFRHSTLNSRPSIRSHVARHPRTRRHRRSLPPHARAQSAGEHVSVRRPGGHRQEAICTGARQVAVVPTDRGDDPLEPCGRCESCRLFDAGSHPDLDVVGLPKDKSTLPLESIHRRQRASQSGRPVPPHFAAAVSRRTQSGDHRRRRLLQPGERQLPA